MRARWPQGVGRVNKTVFFFFNILTRSGGLGIEGRVNHYGLAFHNQGEGKGEKRGRLLLQHVKSNRKVLHVPHARIQSRYPYTGPLNAIDVEGPLLADLGPDGYPRFSPRWN